MPLAHLSLKPIDALRANEGSPSSKLYELDKLSRYKVMMYIAFTRYHLRKLKVTIISFSQLHKHLFSAILITIISELCPQRKFPFLWLVGTPLENLSLIFIAHKRQDDYYAIFNPASNYLLQISKKAKTKPPLFSVPNSCL